MSKIISMNILFHDNINLNIRNLLEVLKNNGWSFIHKGKVNYLPIGDNDDYEWVNEEISANDVLDLLTIKEEKGEKNGISLYWDDSNIGVNLLVHSANEISFDLCYNLKECCTEENSNITDINWYYCKLIMCFIKANYPILEVQYSEC